VVIHIRNRETYSDKTGGQPSFQAMTLVNEKPVIAIPVIILTIFATFFVALRLLSRSKIHGGPGGIGVDDYLVLTCLAFDLALLGLVMDFIKNGIGKPATELTEGQAVNFGKLVIAGECVYCTAVFLTKTSILIMYSRIFGRVRSFRIGQFVLFFCAAGWWIAIMCVSIFQCTPINKAWFPLLPGHCIPIRPSLVGNAMPNILTDVGILALPIRQVWKLQATTRQRFLLSILFGMGCLVIVASILRFNACLKINETNTTVTLGPVVMWAAIEACVATICACLPTLRPLMRFAPGFVSHHSQQRMNFSEGVVTIGGSDSRSSGKKKTTRRGLRDLSFLSSFHQPDKDHGSKIATEAHYETTNGSGDEVPLNTIQVQREVELSANYPGERTPASSTASHT